MLTGERKLPQPLPEASTASSSSSSAAADDEEEEAVDASGVQGWDNALSKALMDLEGLADECPGQGDPEAI